MIIDGETDLDHQKDLNSFISKYQTALEEKFKKSKRMSLCVPITNYVQHSVKETRNTFVVTKHQDDCVFFHNALMLMRAIRCKEYMIKMVNGSNVFSYCKTCTKVIQSCIFLREYDM